MVTKTLGPTQNYLKIFKSIVAEMDLSPFMPKFRKQDVLTAVQHQLDQLVPQWQRNKEIVDQAAAQYLRDHPKAHADLAMIEQKVDAEIDWRIPPNRMKRKVGRHIEKAVLWAGAHNRFDQLVKADSKKLKPYTATDFLAVIDNATKGDLRKLNERDEAHFWELLTMLVKVAKSHRGRRSGGGVRPSYAGGFGGFGDDSNDDNGGFGGGFGGGASGGGGFSGDW